MSHILGRSPCFHRRYVLQCKFNSAYIPGYETIKALQPSQFVSPKGSSFTEIMARCIHFTVEPATSVLLTFARKDVEGVVGRLKILFQTTRLRAGPDNLEVVDMNGLLQGELAMTPSVRGRNSRR